ncbi:f-box domain-containing protein [Diaporthe amygdali]|uniref:f-box domain-containing protein n=1 Tax=Phomopsis amygdali TaxID=1214568 RepID=UPI0022FEADCA|nr:f-box domain-containing protein [Diaporthe amygdali]KAJ0115298.1 f-box domain-containing protein [Diaporthe amygdali]
MVLLTQLPLEIVNHVLSFVDPEDLPRANTTCQYLYHAVKDNSALFRAVYLRHLDAPPPKTELNWVQEIKDLVKLKRICASENPERVSPPPPLTDFVTFGASQNISILRECFSSESTVHAFLCSSFLFQRASTPVKNFVFPKQPPTEERQMSARLHCLYGVPVLNFNRLRSSRTYPFAISKVYDIREYTTQTRWGPFMDEGPGPIGTEINQDGRQGLPSDRVDWEKVEAIMIVLWHNLKTKGLDRLPVFNQFWGMPFAGCWPNSYIPEPINRDITDLELKDPYDVTGTWLRVVCFLDYNDFFGYNFPPHDDLPDHLPRHALDEVEATRLIVVKIRVTKIEPPGPEDGQALPVVHYEGFSKSLDSSLDENANSGLTGSVRLTREGEVRWTSHSIFNGQERWRSESIQVGGLRSSKVVGNWFDKDYDPSGPVGPTAFWKISDRQPGSRDDHITEHDYRAIIDGLEENVDLGRVDDDEEAGLLGVFQINSDDEEYEDAEDDDNEEEDEDDDFASDDGTYVLAQMTSQGLDEK